MVRGNKFKPNGRESAPAAAAAAHAAAKVAADNTSEAHTHAALPKQLGKRRNGGVRPVRKHDPAAGIKARPASQQKDAGGASAAAKDSDGNDGRHNNKRARSPRFAEGGSAQHASVRHASVVPPQQAVKPQVGSKRRRAEPATASVAAAASDPLPTSAAAHSADPRPTSGNGLQSPQHRQKPQRMHGDGDRQPGGRSAPAAAQPATATGQRPTPQAEAAPHHVRKKRRLRTKVGTTTTAATVSVNGVEVRTVVAPPAKGALRMHFDSLPQCTCADALCKNSTRS